MKRTLIQAAVAVVLSFVGCSTAVEMTSSWNDNTVVVDGSNTEWGTSLKPLADPPLALGVRNDDRFLYLCLSTQNPFYQAQIVNGGLTVWFDTSGAQEETFGIRFPNHGEQGPRWNPREPLTTAFSFIEPSFRELAILGPDKNTEIFSLVEVKGIKVKMGASENGLVYELQVPLQTSPEFRHALGITGARILGVGFQTAEPGSDRLQGPSGRPAPGARTGRRGGGARGGGGTPIEGSGPSEVLDLWTEVSLSTRH